AHAGSAPEQHRDLGADGDRQRLAHDGGHGPSSRLIVTRSWLVRTRTSTRTTVGVAVISGTWRSLRLMTVATVRELCLSLPSAPSSSTSSSRRGTLPPLMTSSRPPLAVGA